MAPNQARVLIRLGRYTGTLSEAGLWWVHPFTVFSRITISLRVRNFQSEKINRLEPRLFEVIRGWAQDDLRSINAQIEYLLADQARRTGRLPYKRTPRPPDTSTSPDLDDDEDPETPTSAPGAREAV